MNYELSLPSNDSQASKTALLNISGSLDVSALKDDFLATISAQDKQKLIALDRLTVDLGQVERADTAGLAYLLNLVKDLSAHSIEVRFSHIPQKLSNLAALSNAQDLLVSI